MSHVVTRLTGSCDQQITVFLVISNLETSKLTSKTSFHFDFTKSSTVSIMLKCHYFQYEALKLFLESFLKFYFAMTFDFLKCALKYMSKVMLLNQH